MNKPASGVVLYRDDVLTGVNPHATIVFQTFALFPWLTVQENVELTLKVRGVAQAERTRRAVALLDKVGLDGFENAYPPRTLGRYAAKGRLRRLAMAVEPELLCFLDEPLLAPGCSFPLNRCAMNCSSCGRRAPSPQGNFDGDA